MFSNSQDRLKMNQEQPQLVDVAHLLVLDCQKSSPLATKITAVKVLRRMGDPYVNFKSAVTAVECVMCEAL
jgi:hypothetical protein